MTQKIKEVCQQGKRIWTTTSIGRNDRTGSGNIFAKPQVVYKKSKSGNPDSYNDSLTCRKETPANYTLHAVACSCLKTTDKQKYKQFCVDIKEKFEDQFEELVFNDESTFHTNGKINKHNVCSVKSFMKSTYVEFLIQILRKKSYLAKQCLVSVKYLLIYLHMISNFLTHPCI